MTDDYAELRKALAAGPAGEPRLAIIDGLSEIVDALLKERDALHELTDSRRWYSHQTMDAVVAEREALRGERDELLEALDAMTEARDLLGDALRRVAEERNKLIDAIKSQGTAVLDLIKGDA